MMTKQLGHNQQYYTHLNKIFFSGFTSGIIMHEVRYHTRSGTLQNSRAVKRASSIVIINTTLFSSIPMFQHFTRETESRVLLLFTDTSNDVRDSRGFSCVLFDFALSIILGEKQQALGLLISTYTLYFGLLLLQT